MVALSDFNNVEKPSLSELSPTPQITQVANGATVTNVAAHAALLSAPDSVLKNYSAVNAELSNGTSSATLDALLKQNQTTDQAADYAELQKVLRDPNIGNDVKQQYMDGYINSVSIPSDRSLSVLVGQNANAQTVGPDENDETTATTTFDLNSTLDGVDAYRGWVQNAINTQTTLKSRDGLNLMLDVVESLVPFMDQAAVAKSRMASGGSVGDMFKSLALMGDSKAEMRAAISKMPVKERYEFAQKLIDVVKNTGGSFTIRPNELSIVNQLNTYLVSGTYTDMGKLIDNITSVTDIVFPVSGWINKAAKGARGLKEAAVIAERGAEADARLAKLHLQSEIDHINAVEEASMLKPTLPQAGNVVEDALTLRGKTLSPTAPLTKPGELAPTVNLIDRNLNSAAKAGSRDATGFETGMQGPQKPIMDQIDDVMNESVVNRISTVRTVDHTSVSQTFKDSNPGKARAVNNMVEADKSDDAARILTGTTRKDAIANDRLAEVSAPNGVVRNKVEMDEAGPKPDEAVVNSIIQDRGRIDLDKKEKILIRESVRDAFRDVIGLVPRKAMATLGRDIDEALDTARGVAFDMIYGPKDGGFKNAQQGIKQVLVGLRKYGVKPEEVEVLAKQANGLYAPIKGLPTADGNYLVRVKHNYEFSPGDVVSYSLLENKRDGGLINYNMFDSRVSLTDGSAGSVLQHLIPASALINRVLHDSGSAASEASALIGKKLLQLGKNYAAKYKKLSPRQKALVDMYRIEANEKNIAFSVSNLRARGFDEDAIETMRSWKLTTDTMWALENRDFNKTLRLRGWERFVDQANDTDLIVKSVPNSGFANGVRAYDAEQHTIRNLTKNEVDELYAKGGNIANTKTVVELGDDTFTHIIVKQRSEGSYTRRIRDDDITLPYRDGYYPVKYDAPIFITKKFKSADGVEYRKAIATAGSHADAEQLLTRLRTTDGEGDYVARYDLRKGSNEYEEAEWSAAVSGGRSSQRIRGERLADASRQSDLAHVHIESPEESLISSIRSLAARTAFRDWVETTKARWLSQNSDLLEQVDGYKTLWPSDVRAIGRGNVEISPMRIKDAKATWRYVHAMEAGYTNLLDDMTKNFFRNMSIESGKKGWKWLEKTAGAASEGSLSGFARRKAFRLLLAANPLRQLPVQAMQALPVLLATNPLALPKISMQMILLDYLKNGGDADSFMKVMARTATGMDAKSARQLAKDWEASGFEAAVDANTLIRDQMNHLVDRTRWDKVQGVLRAPLDFTQKIGFNRGESILMRSIWLSEYDLAKKAGKNLDAEGLELLGARVRNLTLNMNKAGELPYNQNVLSAAMQFFQAPHKAFAQIVLGHAGLTPLERAKLGTSYILTYGIGGGYITDAVMSALGSVDPETKDLIEGGLFNLMMNNALSTIYGDEVKLDFSDSLRLLPVSEALNLEFFNNLIGSEVGEVLSNSASASLVFGSNPRLTNLVKQMMRPFTVDWDKKPEELAATAKSFLSIFSGLSNFFKAKYALEYQKSVTAKGRVVDYHVNDLEALAKLAGFNTIDEIHQYAADELLYKTSGKYKDDVKALVDETSARLAAKGISNEEAGWYMDMMGEAQRVFNNDPFYMDEFASQIKYKVTTGENSIYTRLRAMSGWMSPDEYEKFVMAFPQLTDDAKKTLIDVKKMFGTN